jgi:hypothetical protein
LSGSNNSEWQQHLQQGRKEKGMAAIQLVLVYFQVMLLLWSFDDPSLIAEAQAMENPEICPGVCGNVSIPYPFGMREGCYHDESLKILCNSSEIPLLSINGIDLVVTDISVGDSTITVNFPIVFANCDGKERNTVIDLEGSPFVFSSDLNNFIASGCDSLALLIQNQSAVGGCMSICDHERSNNLSSCSGINCCQTRIPSYLKVYNVILERVNDGKGSGKKQQAKDCRHAYLVDGNWMDDRVYGWGGSIMASNVIRDMDHVPVVLDWGIEIRVYESLVMIGLLSNTSNTYNCQVLNPPPDSTNQMATVQCFCKAGFAGNPYLGDCKGKLLVNCTIFLFSLALYFLIYDSSRVFYHYMV